MQYDQWNVYQKFCLSIAFQNLGQSCSFGIFLDHLYWFIFCYPTHVHYSGFNTQMPDGPGCLLMSGMHSLISQFIGSIHGVTKN